ncbi:hypothetical protein TYRP_012555 [Tyrophagus putrescentiae]|nr:hypothetical protein TYRP_012555 [Tyrophagus putrescentiae]
MPLLSSERNLLLIVKTILQQRYYQTRIVKTIESSEAVDQQNSGLMENNLGIKSQFFHYANDRNAVRSSLAAFEVPHH